MCGIAGFYGLEDKKLLDRMTSALNHRGPDDEGYYSDKLVSLGHRRLSIIDLENGKQPIANEDGSIIVVYNGEIYNYKELREELEAKHKFKTNSDTEVLVHLYEEYKEEFVNKLNGFFAFALYDSNEKKLILARDRLGIKPLFYMLLGKKLFFASEQKSLLEYQEHKQEVDPNALYNFLMFNYNKSLQTLFKDIKKVPPGYMLVIKDQNIKFRKYWDLIFNRENKTESEFSNELLELLKDSVQKRLMSDVPLGAYVSGGIDSSSVVGLMASFSQEPIKTFSVGFNQSDDELKYAKIISDHYQTDHQEIYVDHNDISLLKKIIWHLDEPMSDLATIPVYVMSREAKKKVTVVLTGEGNDEIWAGYDHFKNHLKLKELSKITLPFLKLTKYKDYAEYAKKLQKDPKEFLFYPRVFNQEEAKDLYKEEFLQKIQPLDEKQITLRNCFPENADFTTQMLLADTSTLLPDSYLVKVDRMTMAHSIEARVPLIDYRIVELAFKIPASMKIHPNEKAIFRKTVKEYLPKEIINRKKKGFGVPIQLWMREMKDYTSSLLDESAVNKRSYLKYDFVKKLLSNPDPDTKQSLRIWSLVTLELWNQIYEKKYNMII